MNVPPDHRRAPGLSRRALLLAGFGALVSGGPASLLAAPDSPVGPAPRHLITIGDPAGDGQLILADHCLHRPCPLVIVSHCLGKAPMEQLRFRAYEGVFEPLVDHGFALLLSSDAGTDTYGNDAALAYIQRVFQQARQAFHWDGRVYTLGVSMGGLPALLTAYRQTLGQPVQATALIAGVTHLQHIHQGPPARTARVEQAYRGSFPSAAAGHDPVGDFQHFAGRRTPLLVVASGDDSVIPVDRHGARLLALARDAGADARLLKVDGAHIGPGHFTPRVARTIIEFYQNHRHRGEDPSTAVL